MTFPLFSHVRFIFLKYTPVIIAIVTSVLCYWLDSVSSITSASVYIVHFTASLSIGVLSHRKSTSAMNLDRFEVCKIRKIATSTEKLTVRFHASAAD